MKSDLKHKWVLLDRNQVCHLHICYVTTVWLDHKFNPAEICLTYTNSKYISITARSLKRHCSHGLGVVNDMNHDRQSLMNGLHLFILPPFIYSCCATLQIEATKQETLGRNTCTSANTQYVCIHILQSSLFTY